MVARSVRFFVVGIQQRERGTVGVVAHAESAFPPTLHHWCDACVSVWDDAAAATTTCVLVHVVRIENFPHACVGFVNDVKFTRCDVLPYLSASKTGLVIVTCHACCV